MIVSDAGGSPSFVIPPGEDQPLFTLFFAQENIPDPPDVCVDLNPLFSSMGDDSGNKEWDAGLGWMDGWMDE